MGVKNLLDDVKDALSIAQAGIKGTLKALKKTPSKAKKLPARKRTPKKSISPVIARKPKAKGKLMAGARGLRQSNKTKHRKRPS